MTYYDICQRLEAAGIAQAQHDAALLLSHFCGVSASSLALRREEDFDCPDLMRAVERRAGRYPLQYLFGEWDFYRERYEVDENVLIPRPDTELLVELAVRSLPQGAVFADFCTGSGCVAISTLCARPDTSAVATDLFPGTLALAERNGVRNGVADRLTLRCADAMKPYPGQAGSFDAILSNPPYIASAVVPTLAPELAFEPQAALDGGADGLSFYRAIIEGDAFLLKKGGFFLFEIGYDQGRAITALAAAHGFDCRIYPDLGGNDRAAFLTASGDPA